MFDFKKPSIEENPILHIATAFFCCGQTVSIYDNRRYFKKERWWLLVQMLVLPFHEWFWRQLTPLTYGRLPKIVWWLDILFSLLPPAPPKGVQLVLESSGCKGVPIGCRFGLFEYGPGDSWTLGHIAKNWKTHIKKALSACQCESFLCHLEPHGVPIGHSLGKKGRHPFQGRPGTVGSWVLLSCFAACYVHSDTCLNLIENVSPKLAETLWTWEKNYPPVWACIRIMKIRTPKKKPTCDPQKSSEQNDRLGGQPTTICGVLGPASDPLKGRRTEVLLAPGDCGYYGEELMEVTWRHHHLKKEAQRQFHRNHSNAYSIGLYCFEVHHHQCLHP